MNLFVVDFQELYRRHLRRHSQFGINVLHLIAVAGIYAALYAITFVLPGSPWVLGVVLAGYFGMLLFNLPMSLWITNALFVAWLVMLCWLLPPLPLWMIAIYIAAILLLHQFQLWSHKVYNKEQDMSEFTGKYQKGPLLFTLLSLYELPILLNYLVFDRRSWTS